MQGYEHARSVWFSLYVLERVQKYMDLYLGLVENEEVMFIGEKSG
jgi:hypothetical protein